MADHSRYNRVLITGAGGMLGTAVYPFFRERFEHVLATDKDPAHTRLERLDVREADAVRRVVKAFAPDVILHLAADTDLEYCEVNGDYAHENNAVPCANIGKLASECGARLVYISTAGVFDGKKTEPYTEADPAHPLMLYGQSKLDGEVLTRENCPEAIILRAGWMVGGGPSIDHKFVNLMLDQIAAGQTVLHAVNDRLGTPTYTYDFAANLYELLGTDESGTFHMVCEGTGSRYDVACEIVRICGRDDIKVEPVSSDFFREKYFAPRPYSEMMVNARLRELGLNRMRHWREALRDYITRFYANAIVSPENQAAQSQNRVAR